MFDIYSRNPYKAKKKNNLNLNELGCSAFIFSKQLNLEFT